MAYTPWLFEHAYARVQALDIDKQKVPDIIKDDPIGEAMKDIPEVDTNHYCGVCNLAIKKREETPWESWSCDHKLHDGNRRGFVKADKLWGCDTIDDCDWAACEKCIAKDQVGIDEKLKEKK